MASAKGGGPLLEESLSEPSEGEEGTAAGGDSSGRESELSSPNEESGVETSGAHAATTTTTTTLKLVNKKGKRRERREEASSAIVSGMNRSPDAKRIKSPRQPGMTTEDDEDDEKESLEGENDRRDNKNNPTATQVRDPILGPYTSNESREKARQFLDLARTAVTSLRAEHLANWYIVTARDEKSGITRSLIENVDRECFSFPDAIYELQERAWGEGDDEDNGKKPPSTASNAVDSGNDDDGNDGIGGADGEEEEEEDEEDVRSGATTVSNSMNRMISTLRVESSTHTTSRGMFEVGVEQMERVGEGEEDIGGISPRSGLLRAEAMEEEEEEELLVVSHARPPPPSGEDEHEEEEEGEEDRDDFSQASVYSVDVAAESIYALDWFSGNVALAPSKATTGLAYDERMLAHQHPLAPHPERPQRISAIFHALEKSGMVREMYRVPLSNYPNSEELERVHTKNHVAYVESLRDEDVRRRSHLELEMRSAFASEGSVEAAYVSCGLVTECVRSVARGEIRNALAVVRPPGHHAEKEVACGFCLFNNVAVAAATAIAELGFKRVAIIDWDVHHGNGIQHAFESDNRILYISTHRYHHGQFYPGSPDGGPHAVGEGVGLGYNINVGWNGEGPFGDPEYLAAWNSVVVPSLSVFSPDLILVSAGFDAAEGDPLGGCHVTPFGYAKMLHSLCAFAEGKVVVALEGGYSLRALTASSLACAAVLLGKTPKCPPVEREVAVDAMMSIRETLFHHSQLDVEFSRQWTRSALLGMDLEEREEGGEDEEEDASDSGQDLIVSQSSSGNRRSDVPGLDEDDDGEEGNDDDDIENEEDDNE